MSRRARTLAVPSLAVPRLAVALLALTIGLGTGSAVFSAPVATALPTLQTEEGQTVIYDRYTWQRRELDKKLPLNEPWPGNEGPAIEAAFKRFGLDNPPVPASIPVPSRIMTDVYLVNSVPNLTYLIDAGPAGLVLVDPGLTINADAIVKNVERLGFSRSAIKWVLNTHAHFDHSMADAYFQRLGAKILVGRADVAAVEKGTEATGRFAIPPSMMGSDGYPTLKDVVAVDDGERLALGNKTFYAIATPGHTAGSTCYLLTIDKKNILFGGDTLLFDYRLGFQGTPYADDVAYLASLKKLARFYAALPPGKFSWDVLLPGHGAMVLDRAYLDVLKAVRQVEWDVIVGEEIKALPFGDDAYRKYMYGRP